MNDDEVIANVAEGLWVGADVNDAPSQMTQVEADVVSEAIHLLLDVRGLRTRLILALARRATTDEQRAYLTAGLFEDLFAVVEQEELDLIEAAGEEIPYLSVMLRGANPPASPEVASWLDRFCGR